MNKDDKNAFWWSILLVGCFFVGFCCGVITNNNVWHTKSVNAGYAEYNSVTGHWQWKAKRFKLSFEKSN